MQVIFPGLAPGVEAQGHGGLLVVCREQGCRLLRPLLQQFVVEPAGVAGGGRLIQCGRQFLPFALVTAQQGIGHTFCPGLFQRAGGGNGSGDCRVVRYAHALQLIEAAQQQSLHVAIFFPQWFIQHHIQQRLESRLVTQGAVTQLLQQATIALADLFQRRRQRLVEGFARHNLGQHQGGCRANVDGLHGLSRSMVWNC